MAESILNEKQRDAVEHSGSPLLIVAGAGTGKTTVITERIKWLIGQKNYSPDQILALTFTEKAAAEMESRVDISLPLGYAQIWISTFHSFCDRILRDEALHIGLNTNFRLLTEAEATLFLYRHFFQLELNYFRPASNPTKFLSDIINHFSRLRDEDITPDQYLKFADNQKAAADTTAEKLAAEQYWELAQSFRSYQQLKEKEGVMDFADLIGNTLRLFRERPNVLAEYQEKFRHILVDEFQDTNIAQNELLRLLVGNKNNITVVGDDDQSIYKWRGAAISNIIQFKESFPQAKIVVLTENYRSTDEILSKAYRLIQFNNPDRLEIREKIDKKITGNRKVTGEPVELIWEEKVEDEAETVAREIGKLAGDRKKFAYQDVAILIRANNHAEPFVRALSRHGVPFQFLGPGQLFHQPEVKDLIAYLTLLADPENNVAAWRVSQMEIWAISPRDLAFIRSFARRYNFSLVETLEMLAKEERPEKYHWPKISAETTKGIKKLIEILERHFKLTGKESGGQILFYFLQDSDLLKKYLDPKTEQEQLAGLNIARFFEKVKSFESQNREVQINDLLDWITLRLEMGESPLAAEIDWTSVNAVNILTIHSAKGLEFPVVFLVNLVDRRFPTTQRTETIPVPQPLIKEILPEGNSHEQEERRLFYVGMTRAKDRLFFTAADFYHEAKTQKRLSPFVVEAMGEKEISRFKNQKQRKVVSPQLSLLEWGKKKIEPTEQASFNAPVTHLSISQIETFDICERQYKYRYVLSIPTLPTPSLTQGNIIHQTLKTFYQQQLVSNKKLSLKQLLKILEDNWSSEGFSSKAQQEAAKKSAVRMMTNFYEQEFRFESVGQVVALEQPFALRLTPTLKVGGRIDRIDNIGKDSIEIIDYKTGTKTPTQKEVDQDKQLTLYALAATSISIPPLGKPLEKIKLSLYYLDEGKKFSTRRQETDVEKIKDKIFTTAQAIEKTGFPPKPNRPFPCNYCEFRLICDAWK